MVRHLDASLLSPGQVLLVDDPDHPGRLRLHRLVEIGQDGRLITNGDANRNEESSPVQVTALHGAAFLRIPYAGLPAYWICTGQVAPLVTSVALVGLLLGGVRLGRLLEDPEERERRRHRGIRLRGLHRAAAAVGALGVLSAPAIMPAAAAHAAFAAMTSTTGNTWGTACTDRAPGTGMTPSLHYGYGPGSTDIPDLGPRGDTGTFRPGASRSACAAGSTPYAVVDGSRTWPHPTAVSIATCFRVDPIDAGASSRTSAARTRPPPRLGSTTACTWGTAAG